MLKSAGRKHRDNMTLHVGDLGEIVSRHLILFLQFSHLAPDFTLNALPRDLTYVERAKFLRGEMPCVTLGPK